MCTKTRSVNKTINFVAILIVLSVILVGCSGDADATHTTSEYDEPNYAVDEYDYQAYENENEHLANNVYLSSSYESIPETDTPSVQLSDVGFGSENIDRIGVREYPVLTFDMERIHTPDSSQQFARRLVVNLGDTSIDSFDFLANYDNIEVLSIRGGTIYSFDCFAENLTSVQILRLHEVNIHQDAGPIPHIASLSNLSIHAKIANEVEENDFQATLELVVNNSHVTSFGFVFVDSSPYTHGGTVHITLESLSEFVNMTHFSYGNYATTLDVSALKYATNLVSIWITSSVGSVLNLQCLAYLPNLETLGLPPQEFRNPALDLLPDSVQISNGM